MTHRLVRVCVTCLGQQSYCHRSGKVQIPKHTWGARGFGTGPKATDEDGSGSDTREPPGSGAQRLPWGTSLFGRRRPLSPLERVSRLLPQEMLSPEVWDLREAKPQDGEGTTEDVQTDRETLTGPGQDTTSPAGERGRPLGALIRESTAVQSGGEEEGASDAGRVAEEEEEEEERDVQGEPRVTLPGERPLCYGEVLLAEHSRRRRLEFRKMFQLKEGLRLLSKWGMIPHEAIAGRPAGSVIRTSLGLPILLRRPSLDEFTLFMKRGPAIAYPKDASAMLLLMDVSEGDCVLESGSGSGAMTLFLSRAVGSKGRVVSLEVREDHHRRAVLNYQRWRSSWSLRRGEDWPDNAELRHADLQTAAPLLAGQAFHSIALDMLNPHMVLPTVTPHLHPGAVCAVYLANVTQVIDLMEGLRCSTLPLVCERIIEVQYRDWLLAPALRKDGTFNTRKALGDTSQEEEEDQSHEEENEEESHPFGSVPYIARPHPEQGSHTAFLVKLRKILK